MSEAVAWRCSAKKMFLEIWQISQEKAFAGKEFCRPEACNFIEKETPAQAFSCGFSEISENTFFTEHPPVAASETSKQGGVSLKVTIFTKIFILDV